MNADELIDLYNEEYLYKTKKIVNKRDELCSQYMDAIGYDKPQNEKTNIEISIKKTFEEEAKAYIDCMLKLAEILKVLKEVGKTKFGKDWKTLREDAEKI